MNYHQKKEKVVYKGFGNYLDKLSRGYKYLTAQDAPLWKTIFFVIKNQKEIGKFLFFGSDKKTEISATIYPAILCHEICVATGCEEKELWKYHEEFRGDLKFYQSVREKLFSTSERPNKNPEFGYRELFYILVRAIKPKTMIETGSYDGLGTAAMLLGMHKNNVGTLFTIDLPNPRLPKDIKAEPAWIVPDYLRYRLVLTKGKSSTHLKPIIDKVKVIDAFYHDSWHAYDNMMFEYEAAWRALRSGGFFISEYLPDYNMAFKDFIKDKTVKPVITANNTHFILRKP